MKIILKTSAPWISTLLLICLLPTAQAANCTAALDFSYYSRYNDNTSAIYTYGTQELATLEDIVEYLSPCETFNGSIVFNLDNTASAITLNKLKTVTGSLSINRWVLNYPAPDNNTNGSPTSLSLDALESVGGDFTIATSTISQLNLSSLVSVNGSLEILDESSRLASLDVLQIAKLQSVGGKLQIQGFSMLKTIDLSSLTLAGSVEVNRLPSLTQLTFQHTVRVADGYVDQHVSTRPQLSTITINGTQLETAQSFFFSNSTSIAITNNPNLQSALFFQVESDRRISTAFNIDDVGITVLGNGPDLNVTFPQMTTYLGDITFDNPTSLGIGKLQSVLGTLTILGSITKFEAASLTSVTKLVFGGPSKDQTGASSAVFPVLKAVGTFTVVRVSTRWTKSSLDMPLINGIGSFSISDGSSDLCRYWRHQKCLGVISGLFSCDPYYQTSHWRESVRDCNRDYPATGFTYKQKMEIGFGLGLGVPLLALFCFCGWQRRRSRPPPLSPHSISVELVEQPGDRELPKYQLHDTSEGGGILPRYSHTEMDSTDRAQTTTASRVRPLS